MLECALALLAEDRSLAAPDIQGCVKDVAEYAKTRGYHVEQLIIDLKQTWHSIADSGAHPKSEVTSPLITMCIEEFYSATPEPSGD
ncbi:MAG: hypothetical protein H0W63_01610 [Gemmatimonadaceae bacterium]|nr:hypothetical protein [Gemmatimonadaceae bacterium]